METDGKPKWGNIIVSGHSQGAGHANFAAFLHEFQGAALFSGPQNCCGNLYIDREFATPTNRISAMYHLQEDASGAIADNLSRMCLPAVSIYPDQFPAVSESPLQRSDHAVVGTRIIPKATCVPGVGRAEHISTASDTCAPLLYTESLWNSVVLFSLPEEPDGEPQSTNDNDAKLTTAEVTGVVVGGIAGVALFVSAFVFSRKQNATPQGGNKSEPLLLPKNLEGPSDKLG
jgi:hypothetical protein